MVALSVAGGALGLSGRRDGQLQGNVPVSWHLPHSCFQWAKPGDLFSVQLPLPQGDAPQQCFFLPAGGKWLLQVPSPVFLRGAGRSHTRN